MSLWQIKFILLDVNTTETWDACLALTTIATVGAGDEFLRPLIAILLLGPQAEAADGDGLCHRLAEGQRRRGKGGDTGERRES